MKKLASGWNDPRLPGQFFPSKDELVKRLAAFEQMPFSNDRTIDFKRSEPPPWQPSGDIRVVGDTIYEGGDKLLTIPDQAAREEFVMDYSTAPADQKVNVFNQWRNRLRGTEEQVGKPPPPERRVRSGGEDSEIEVDTDNWHGRAYVKRIFIPGKEDKNRPLPGQKEKKPRSIPIYHRGIEVTHKSSGDIIKFPLTVRGGVATFGDSRPHKEMQIKPRYKPSELVDLLAKLVGDQNARTLVDSAMGGMTSYMAQASTRWVATFCKFAQAQCDHSRDESWWENDARGIPLARVCDRCIEAVLSKFNPAVLTDDQREMLGVRGRQPDYGDVVEEPIEPEEY